MRKMNKIVALSLVLAMALSMMASAASFKDQATINADLIDEINLLVNLGVYSEQGTGAGYFEPDMTITRAQAAKIIYVLKNKGNDNGATSWTGLNIFNDVEAGAWYEGYVNYCASTGILAGTGDGTYKPNETLTGVQLAKMLLVVIGYKADVEGYTGNGWDANILADAEEAGFFVDYELSVKGIVTRQWAAQMIVNAINATKVKYEDGEATELYEEGKPVTFAELDLGLKTITGVLVETPNIKLVDNKGDETPANNEKGKNKNSMVLVYDEETAKFASKATAYEFAADPALLGSFVDVLVKKGTDKVYGITADEANIITKTTVDAVEYDAADFKGITVFEDYTVAEHDTTMWGKNDNREVSLVDWDDNGVYDVALVAGVEYGQVDYTNPAKYILRVLNTELASISKKADYETINFIDTVEKGDVVKITKDYATGELVYNVEKLDVIEGAITRVNSSNVATIDGAAYELGAKHIIPAEKDEDGKEVAFELKVNKTVQEYFVDGDYIIFTGELSSANDIPTNFAILINKGQVEKTDVFGNTVTEKDDQDKDVPVMINKVEVLLNDGTQAVYELKGDNYNALTKDTIYEYEIKSGKISLIAVAAAYNEDVAPTAKAVYDESTAKLTFKNSKGNVTATYRANDETFFFVIDEDGDYAVVTASEIKNDMSLSGENFIVEEDGFVYVVAAVLEGEIADNTKVYGIAANSYDEEIDAEDVEVVYIDVTSLAGVTEKLTVKKSEFVKNDFVGKFVEYTIDEDGYAALTVKNLNADYTTAAITHVAEDGIVVADYVKSGKATTKDLVLADDVKIYYVEAFKTSSDKARVSVTEGDEIVTSIEADTNTYELSAAYKTNSDGEVSHIVVEVTGAYIWANGKINTVVDADDVTTVVIG